MFVQIVLITWPRWLPCLYMVKTFKNLLLQNRMPKIIETWYVALGTTKFVQMMIQVDLWPSYAKVRFGSLCFSIVDVLETIAENETKQIYEDMNVFDVKVILWPWSKVTQISSFSAFSKIFSQKPLCQSKSKPCRSSLRWGNKSFFHWSWSYDGSQAHIW